MSPAAVAGDRAPEGFPRVSGDEPCFRASASAFFMFSPRERG